MSLNFLFLAIPLCAFAIVGGLIYLIRRPPSSTFDGSIRHFNSELDALAPPGVVPTRRDPVRPPGYPRGDQGDDAPVDVLLARPVEPDAESGEN